MPDCLQFSFRQSGSYHDSTRIVCDLAGWESENGEKFLGALLSRRRIIGTIGSQGGNAPGYLLKLGAWLVIGREVVRGTLQCVRWMEKCVGRLI